jgi:lipoprotein-anchoring transpeptidase ErfK/SrfK
MTGRQARAWAGRVSVALTLLVACIPCASADVAKTTPVVPTQQLVQLLDNHQARSRPDGDLAGARTLTAWRPITGSATVLPVVARTTVRGVSWLQVRVPGRPNGGKGWIVQRGTVLTTTGWHVVARTSSRRVLVYRFGHLVRTFSAIVGKPSTPTPHGKFFVEESVRMRAGSAGAPFALATSARSNVLQEFEGGPGQIAIHGVHGLTGAAGTAASHGCVRLQDRAIGWLVAHIAPGVPVTIMD